MISASHAQLEQLFGNCHFCRDWCKCKKNSAKVKDGMVVAHPKQRGKTYCRNTNTDGKSYLMMKNAYARFQAGE
eukprot:12498861-Ditylum_brightwellii.AAC.1